MAFVSKAMPVEAMAQGHTVSTNWPMAMRLSSRSSRQRYARERGEAKLRIVGTRTTLHFIRTLASGKCCFARLAPILFG